MTRLEAQQ